MVNMIIHKNLKRFAALMLALVLAVSPMCVTAFAADEGANSNVIPDGIYNIVSSLSGKLLEAFDFKFDTYGRMHLDTRRGVKAQEFAIIHRGNNVYSIYPQNDGGTYMLECPLNSEVGTSVYKSDADDSTNRFYITKNNDGTVRIRPADPKLAAYSLAESTTRFAHYYYSLCELQKHSASTAQRWVLENTGKKIEVTLSLNKDHDTVKQYTVNELYAVVTPSAYADSVVWSSSDKKVALVDDSGSFCAFATGTAVITASLGDKSVSCTVTVSDKDAFAWYSQCNMYTGGWNAVALKDLYFYSQGVYKRFMIDGFNNKADWMDEGCALASLAMVLRNLDARMTEGYDLRSGQSGNLEADPYTCALANTYSDGARSVTEILYNDPIYTSMGVIVSRFKVDGKSIKTSTYYYANKKMIKEQLDLHPEGVIIGMDSRYMGSHYIVITKCINPDAQNPNDYQFLVCDPAAYNAKDGNNVLFEQSTSYKDFYYRYYDMWTLTTLTVAD